MNEVEIKLSKKWSQWVVQSIPVRDEHPSNQLSCLYWIPVTHHVSMLAHHRSGPTLKYLPMLGSFSWRSYIEGVQLLIFCDKLNNCFWITSISKSFRSQEIWKLVRSRGLSPTSLPFNCCEGRCAEVAKENFLQSASFSFRLHFDWDCCASISFKVGSLRDNFVIFSTVLLGELLIFWLLVIWQGGFSFTFPLILQSTHKVRYIYNTKKKSELNSLKLSEVKWSQEKWRWEMYNYHLDLYISKYWKKYRLSIHQTLLGWSVHIEYSSSSVNPKVFRRGSNATPPKLHHALLFMCKRESIEKTLV